METLEAEGGWAVVTIDKGIRNRPAERAALLKSKLTFFFLAPAWQGFSVPEQAVSLIRSWAKMVQFFDLVAGGANLAGVAPAHAQQKGRSAPGDHQGIDYKNIAKPERKKAIAV